MRDVGMVMFELAYLVVVGAILGLLLAAVLS